MYLLIDRGQSRKGGDSREDVMEKGGWFLFRRKG